LTAPAGPPDDWYDDEDEDEWAASPCFWPIKEHS
jgi:hypothetical protein